ncbi:hypothetical protein [Sediminicola sp. 1XM1-17]|uniref:hypothetical protein n=1 Tax=Sediminicola sp. 1XM1-17 TaxID=3127702 RepID=UPI0030784A1D
MMKTIIILAISILSLTFCNAQKIEMKKTFVGYKYSQNGNTLSFSELSDTLMSNNVSFELIKKAKTKAIFSTVLSVIGGGLTGYPIGTALRGDDPNWTLAGIGVGFFAIGVPIAISADKNVKHAVENYNSSLDQTAFKNMKPELKIVANSRGVGLQLNY